MKTNLLWRVRYKAWRGLIIGAISVLPLHLASAALEDGLIAHYPFTGNANDASTNGNNGTVAGAQLTTDRNGNPNQAYLFNGTSDYINVGQGVKPNFPLTITAWIYPTSTDIEAHTIFRTGTFNNNGNYNGVLFTYSGRGFTYSFYGKGVYTNANNYRGREMVWPPTAILSNQWTHVAVAWLDYQTTRFYVNGVLKADRTSGYGNATTIVNTATDGAIGLQDNPGYPAPFKGKLDEIRVYSRELSAAEIQTLAVEPPQVTIQPPSVTTNASATVSFFANATGAAPLSYQWQFQNTNLNGATGTTLTLTNVMPANSGTYRVIVSNPVGTNNAQATLSVQPQVTCLMPALFTNSVPFTVAINVVPPTGTSFYGIQDQPPAGWPVTQISNGGSYSSGKVQWLLGDGLSRTVTYVVRPPAGAVGTNHFSGSANFNGATTLPIVGVRDVYNEVVTLSIATISFFGEPHAKVTVQGKAGASYHILVADSLQPGSQWRTNDTILLNQPSQDWLDVEPLVNARFYRVRPAP